MRIDVEQRATTQGQRDVVKMTVNLPRQSAEMLREIAGRRGVTVTEALRQMISTEKHLQDALDQGGKILIEYPDKGVRELIFR